MTMTLKGLAEEFAAEGKSQTQFTEFVIGAMTGPRATLPLAGAGDIVAAWREANGFDPRTGDLPIKPHEPVVATAVCGACGRKFQDEYAMSFHHRYGVKPGNDHLKTEDRRRCGGDMELFGAGMHNDRYFEGRVWVNDVWYL
jgi:hypothetical protein